jgi:hypothetical protein
MVLIPVESLRSRVAPQAPAPRCDLCAEPLAEPHRHLFDASAREISCACRACALLFDRPQAGGARYLLVPQRRWWLPDLVLDDVAWAGLRIPVRMAFIYHDSSTGEVSAGYPSAGGMVNGAVDPHGWQRIVAANPVLARLRPDVEALLLSRSSGGDDTFLVPIDDCYALVGLMRTHWQGFTGGQRMWTAVGEFFAGLRARASRKEGDRT